MPSVSCYFLGTSPSLTAWPLPTPHSLGSLPFPNFRWTLLRQHGEKLLSSLSECRLTRSEGLALVSLALFAQGVHKSLSRSGKAPCTKIPCTHNRNSRCSCSQDEPWEVGGFRWVEDGPAHCAPKDLSQRLTSPISH